MSYSPKENLDRINTVVRAWQTLRPTKTFGGLTLAQFKTKVQPSLDARATIETLEHQLTAATDQRDDSDAASLDAIKLVVNSVKGDPTETAKGEFYEALGFVRESERKSGLHRATPAPVAPTKV
jgi:hypothetical protein